MQVGAMILAAGMSSRMGSFKPLLEIAGQSMIQRVIQTFAAVGCKPIVVVTGRNADMLQEHVRMRIDKSVQQHIIFVHNPAYEATQMLDSVKCGLRVMAEQEYCNSFFLTPVDIPLFQQDTLLKMLEKANRVVVKPSFENKGGHPLLIPFDLIRDILSYDGPGGLKQALKEACEERDISTIYVDTPDRGILLDADTKEEFEKMINWQQIIVDK